MDSSDRISSTHPQEPFLDTTALQRLQDTLGSLANIMFPELLEDFFKDSVRLLADARRALELKNTSDLGRCAHTLKSHGATFGATVLSATAKELEMLAKQGILDGAAALIDRSAQEFEQIKPVLENYCKGL